MVARLPSATEATLGRQVGIASGIADNNPIKHRPHRLVASHKNNRSFRDGTRYGDLDGINTPKQDQYANRIVAENSSRPSESET